MQFADFRHQREIHDILQASNPANKFLASRGAGAGGAASSSLFDGVPPESKLQLIHPQTFVQGPSGAVVAVDFSLHQQAMVSASMLSSQLLLPTSSSSSTRLPPLATRGRRPAGGENNSNNNNANSNNSAALGGSQRNNNRGGARGDAGDDNLQDVTTRLLLSRQSTSTEVSIATVNDGIEIRDLKLEQTILTAKSRRYRRQLKSLLMTEITNSQQRLSLCRNGVSDPYGYQQELTRLREAPTPPHSKQSGSPSTSPTKLGAVIEAHAAASVDQITAAASQTWGEVHEDVDGSGDSEDDDSDDEDAEEVQSAKPLLAKRKSFFFTDVPDWEATTPTSNLAGGSTAAPAAGSETLNKAASFKKKSVPLTGAQHEGSGFKAFGGAHHRGCFEGSRSGRVGGPQFCPTPTDDALPPLRDLPPPSQLHRRGTQLPPPPQRQRFSSSSSPSIPLALTPSWDPEEADDPPSSSSPHEHDHHHTRSPNRSPCSDTALLEQQQQQLEKQREDFFRFPDFQASMVLARDGVTSPLLLGPIDKTDGGGATSVGGDAALSNAPAVYRQEGRGRQAAGAGRKAVQHRGGAVSKQLTHKKGGGDGNASGKHPQPHPNPTTSMQQPSLSLSAVVDDTDAPQARHTGTGGGGGRLSPPQQQYKGCNNNNNTTGSGNDNGSHRRHDQLVSNVRAMRRVSPMPSGKLHMAIVSASHAVADEVAGDAIAVLQRRVGEQRKKYAKKYEAMDLQKSKLPFHATPSAVLQHVERLIVQQEKASSRKDAHQRVVDKLVTIETYCLNRFRNPTARQLVHDTHRLVVDEDVIPTREMFLTRLIHKVPPQLFLLDELTTVAVHLGEVYGLTRPLAVQVLRTYAGAFVVDRTDAVAQCLSDDSDGEEWGGDGW